MNSVFSPEDEVVIINRAAFYNANLKKVALNGNSLRLRRGYKFKTVLLPTVERYLNLRFNDEVLILVNESHVSITLPTKGQPGVVTFQCDRMHDSVVEVYATMPSGIIESCGEIQVDDLEVGEVLDHLEAAIKLIELQLSIPSEGSHANV